MCTAKLKFLVFILALESSVHFKIESFQTLILSYELFWPHWVQKVVPLPFYSCVASIWQCRNKKIMKISFQTPILSWELFWHGWVHEVVPLLFYSCVVPTWQYWNRSSWKLAFKLQFWVWNFLARSGTKSGTPTFFQLCSLYMTMQK